VAGYDAYSHGKLIGSSEGPSPSMNITGLGDVSVYYVSLKARDAVGNISLESSVLAVPKIGNVTSRGEWGNIYSKEKAFDGDFSTKFRDVVAATWIQIEYSTSMVYNQYKMFSAGDSPTRDPKDWTLKGSNDGINYTLLDTQTNQSWAGRAVANNYLFNNSTSYKFYKFDITANIGDVQTQIGEVIFRNDNSAPTAPTTLNASMLTSESFLLSWSPSTDDVAVTGYDVYKDDVFLGSTNGFNNYQMNGLKANTTYSITVFAKDAAGKISNSSLPLLVTTLNATGIRDNVAAWFRVYGKNGQIVTDLAGVAGESTVRIIDLRGLVLKTVKTSDSSLNISFPNKGIYLVQVQNGGRSYTQKVVLF
jgi:hypothetical protein